MRSVRVLGQENIPNKPSLFLPNRMDASTRQELETALGGAEKVVYLVEEDLKPMPSTLAGVSRQRIITFNFRTSKSIELREKLMQHFEKGQHFIFIPGRPAQIMGCISDVPKPFLMQLSSVHISPVPVFTGYYRNSIWQAYTSRAQDADYAVVHISAKLTPGPQSGERTLEAWLNASAEHFAEHPLLNKSLARLVLEGMKHNRNSVLIDGTDRSQLSFSKLLGISLALARELKKTVRGESRLGIILPPGKGGMIANYACIFAGIVPVNINYTSSENALQNIIARSGIRHFITAQAFMEKLPDFVRPAEDTLLHLDVLLRRLGMARIAWWVAFAGVAPVGVIARMFSMDARKGEDEAALLFTSGSSGKPKGVGFTHRMVIANILQLLSRVYLPPGSRFLCSLPIFHSFGLTVCTLLPVLYGFSMVTYPSPLEAKSLNDLISHYKCTLVLTTPTFARAMLRRANETTYRSVRYFIVGAEKLQKDLATSFRLKCGVELLEGYGLTETSPVCGVNLPDEPLRDDTPYYVPGTTGGSVGQLLPGLAVRITDPDHDDRRLPLSEQGMIWLKGAQVFRGYINEEQSNVGIFRDGWFKTGDLGYVDLNAFLTLAGRRSRFSKVAGEMVPHEVVETAIEDFAAQTTEHEPDRRCVAIVGVPDAQKGEALVLLSAVHQTNLPQALDAIRAHLADRGIPRLWSPREIIPVENIPLLPTGKLDLRGCTILAREALGLHD